MTPGSPEFMVTWEALQQFVDNSEDVEDEATAVKVAVAQKIIDRMAKQFVADVETLAAALR
jgi:hypothetical protein